MLSAASPSLGQELSLSFDHGLVTLTARDVSLDAILDEWSTVGGTEFVDARGSSPQPLHLQLVDTPEPEALRIILRNVAGYVAAPRTESGSGASTFRRVIVMPTSTGGGRSLARPAMSPVQSGRRGLSPGFRNPQPSVPNEVAPGGMTESDALESLRQLLPQPATPLGRGGNGEPGTAAGRPPTAPRPGMPVDATDDDAAPVFIRPVRPQPGDR